MTDQTRFFLACGIASLVAGVALFFLIRGAQRLKLIDHPGGRKTHVGSIPLVGGLSALVGLLVASLWFDGLQSFDRMLLATSTGLVVLGAWDDRHGLKVRVRVLLQAIVILTMILSTGMYVRHLGTIFGGPVSLGWFGIPFTMIALVGLLNAFNLMDGIDGLATSLGMIAVAGILIAFGGSMHATPALLVLMGVALLPSLAANLGIFGPRGKCFLGDAGSTLIGYMVGWALIALSQKPGSSLSPVGALWCVALPVLDTLAVMYRRIRRGQSPFKAGRGHIHYLLRDSGVGAHMTLLVLIAVAASMWLFGELVRELGLGAGSNLSAFAVLALVYVLATNRWDIRLHGIDLMPPSAADLQDATSHTASVSPIRQPVPDHAKLGSPAKRDIRQAS